jgi:hypothetical protein
LGVVLPACSPIIRPATFAGARDQVTDTSLHGPFDGQVVDADTGDPVHGALVLAVWSYDKGEGFVAPGGSETMHVLTDQAGRYRIPAAPLRIRGPSVRLVGFHLVVYKRGYIGYRSDSTYEGAERRDFVLRHNRVALRKWNETDSHAQHLMFLAAPPQIQQLGKWEREPANLDLYQAMGGAAVVSSETSAGPEGPAPSLRLLDATAILTPEEVRLRTNYTGAFEVKELEDLTRTHFYHGVHLQAVDRTEAWDVAYRVWKDPPGGLEPVAETFRETLPGVDPGADVTPETWVLDSPDVRAVAFLVREDNIGVLLACRAMQCVDVETAIVLARYILDNLGALKFVDAPKAPFPVASPAAEEPGPASPATAEPAGHGEGTP